MVLHGKKGRRLFTKKRFAFRWLAAMDEASVVTGKKAACPVVGTRPKGRGYFDDFGGKRNYAAVGRVSDKFPGAKCAQVLQLQHTAY